MAELVNEDRLANPAIWFLGVPVNYVCSWYANEDPNLFCLLVEDQWPEIRTRRHGWNGGSKLVSLWRISGVE